MRFSIALLSHLAALSSTFAQSFDQRNNVSATSTINTTIVDQDGHDISTAFQKLVYYYNPRVDAASGRNTSQPDQARSLDNCGETQGLFVESFCNYENGVPGSIQSYTYKCLNHKRGVRNKQMGIVEVVAYTGKCDEHEICVNSEGREGDWSSGSSVTAFCINTDAFVAPTDEKYMDFSGATLTTLLTSPDMKTPLMGAKIDVETEISSLERTDRHGISKECSQCLSLATDKLEANTTSISLSETWLMARAVALSSIAGVLLMIILVL